MSDHSSQIFLVFTIDNKKKDYVECYKAIKELQETKAISNETVKRFFSVSEKSIFAYERSMAAYEIKALPKDSQNSLSKLENSIQSQQNKYPRKKLAKLDFADIGFYFRVHYDSEDDCVNLQYFFLIKKFFGNCLLGLICDKGDDQFKVSNFLIFESLKNHTEIEVYSAYVDDKCKIGLRGNKPSIFMLQDNSSETPYQVNQINLRGLSASLSFLPLIDIDKTALHILSSNAALFFDENAKIEIPDYMVNDSLTRVFPKLKGSNFSIVENFYNDCKASSKMQYQSLLKINESDLEKLYKETMVISIFQSILKMLKEKKLLKNKELIDMLKQSSVLSVCLFCSLFYYVQEKGEELTGEIIESLLSDAKDLSEGMLQIIENAFKHAGAGYFSYRIHKKDTEYFSGKYKLQSVNAKCFIEVIVSDIYNEPQVSEQAIIVSKFLENVVKYKQEYDIDEFLSTMQRKLSLMDFFVPDKEKKGLWNEFYSEGENINHHYGLALFEQIVEFFEGYFKVVSSPTVKIKTGNLFLQNIDTIKKESDALEVEEETLPGTHYEVVLPLKNILIQRATGNNATLQFKNLLMQKIQIIENEQQKNTIVALFNEHREADKYDLIQDIQDTLSISNSQEAEIFINQYDFKSLDSTFAGEIFAKAFIGFLTNKNHDFINCKLAILGTDAFVSEFAGCFSIFYSSRLPENPIDLELYLYSEERDTEILFCGSSLEESYEATKLFSSEKGEYSKSLKILERANVKYGTKKESGENDRSIQSGKAYLPYDVLVKNHGSTIFENKVVHDLNRNIQQESFGCALTDTHMKVGSKIHITQNFYEAALLFSFSNYVSRFAYLLTGKIIGSITQKRKTDPIVLFGYETYSEALLVEIKKALTEVGYTDVNYVIFEQAKSIRFKFLDVIESKLTNEETSVFNIVPVGSTLTTFDKIIAEIDFKLSRKDSIAQNVVLNLCLVLIKDGSAEVDSQTSLSLNEAKYWTANDTINKIITTGFPIGSGNKVHYFTSVENLWHNPLDCEDCFPALPRDERPILKVNKASVVPMTLYGLTTQAKIKGALTKKKTFKVDKSFKLLKNNLNYGHYLRGDNHFQFYIKTEQLLLDIFDKKENVACKNEFDGWAKTIKENTDRDEQELKDFEVFNILVSPLHETNTRFVQEIKERVFPNAKQIIWLDNKKDFRDNIKAKYSNIVSLYKNHLDSGKKAVISFHYVNDSVYSGETLLRIKSLIKSLFSEIEDLSNENIKVNIFRSVILLINRCSNDTKSNYIENTDNYYSFINLNISSMRNYEDSCTYCKAIKDYKNIVYMSSTNLVANAASEKIKYLEPVNVEDEKQVRKRFEEIGGKHKLKPDQLRQRNYYRMLYTHLFNEKFSSFGNAKNDKERVAEAVIEVMLSCVEKPSANRCDQLDKLFSAIKVITRPFLVYRRSVKEAVLKIIIDLTDHILFGKKQEIYEKIYDFLDASTDKDEKRILLKLLISSLSNLSSNYILRAKNIGAFWKYVQNITDAHHSVADFENFYVQRVKRHICLSEQDNLCVWFEHFLAASKEYNTQNALQLEGKKILETHFGKLLFLENASIILNAVNEVFKKIENEDNESNQKNISSTILSSYFCEDYRQFCEVNNTHGLYSEEERGNKDFYSEELLRLALIKKHLLAKKSENTVEDFNQKNKFYEDLLRLVESVLDASVSLFYVKNNSTITHIADRISHNAKSGKEAIELIAANAKKEAQSFVVSPESYNDYGGTFYEKDGNKSIYILKFVDNSHDKTDFSILLCQDKISSETRRLRKIRNLLSLRYYFMQKLNHDFNNDIFFEYHNLKEKVKKLSNEKAGNHTPYDELNNSITMLLKNNEKLDPEICRAILTLSSDALISKLYVTKYSKGFDHFKAKGWGIDHKIDTFMELIKYVFTDYINNRINNRGKVKLNLDIPVNFDKEKCPNGCNYFNLMFIWAMLANAMKHGATEEEKGSDVKTVKVTITIETLTKGTEEEVYLVIENAIPARDQNKDKDITKKEGITIETISAYFKDVYGKGILAKDDSAKFKVKIPLYSSCENKKCFSME